ncbi:PAS domain S-box protein [Phenylobacterium sp. J426]|uniref:sensor histidine kinase n=1 Tax=Phenylobacterium sp. J426 TaxID=2898439 RepID=UPI002150CD51|nr:PAS domain S-box protein [Phenylobacterium sp. J426]MCR5873239.1 PAS domain S-box protein [Phenylobacterium sp. J426]
MLNPIEALRPFFETASLNPHGICLLWRPELIWTHAISDVLIGLAYFSIPLALGVFLYHRRDVRFGWAVWLFVLFIMLCGVTHFMMVWTLWNPDYGIEALIKAATALASIVTAVALWPLLPKAIAIPSTAAMQARIDERDAALVEARAAMASMVRMEEHQRQQSRLLEEVHRSEARLRSIFENAAVGIARVALDGTFLEVNESFCQIAGWRREELLKGGFQRITHPEDLDADLAHLSDLLAGRIGSYTMEKRYIRSDGRSIWVDLTVSLARTAGGDPDHFVAIAQDVDEKRRSEETRDLLMREVDHRARNALTVVQSMVRLTEAAEPQRFKAVVSGRIDALARAQASLSQRQWQGGWVADVVAQELSSAAPREQWTAAGPEVELRPEQVQPLSMILHELATNALKYGGAFRPDGPGGRRMEPGSTRRLAADLARVRRSSGQPASAPGVRLEAHGPPGHRAGGAPRSDLGGGWPASRADL